MRILFDDIPESGLTLEVTDTSWFPEEDWVRVGPVRAEMFLSRIQSRVLLNGRLVFTSRFECDRCLEPYEEVQDFQFRIDFEWLAPDDLYWQAEDHQCPTAEMDVVVLSEPEIDIEATLEQQVILSVPAKRLCSGTCQGLCVACGQNLNQGICACSGRNQNSPFQILAHLKLK